MTAQEIATMLVSRLFATVGSETVKIRLAVPAIKLPSAALISSNQLMRESICGYVTGEAKLLSKRTNAYKFFAVYRKFSCD